MVTKEEYEDLVKEALRKLNEKCDKLPVRDEEQEIVNRLPRADDGQLKKIMEILDQPNNYR